MAARLQGAGTTSNEGHAELLSIGTLGEVLRRFLQNGIGHAPELIGAAAAAIERKPSDCLEPASLLA